MAMPPNLLVLSPSCRHFTTQQTADCYTWKSKPRTTTTNGSSIAESGLSQRIRFRDKKYTKEGYAQETDGAPTITEGAKSGTTAHAMTVLRNFGDGDKYEYSVITIEDDGLRALLLHALAHYPWLSHSTTVLFVSLYEPIVHNWSLLNAFADNDLSNPAVCHLHDDLKSKSNYSAATSDNPLAPLTAIGNLEKATADLKLLLNEVRRTPGLESYFSGTREMQEKTDTVSFDYLWTIFPPGELIFSSVFMERPQAFIVKYCSSDYMKRGNSSKEWILECWTYDWNGTTFSRVPVEFSFEEFKGTRSITSLSCYPLRLHRPSSDDIENTGEVKSGEAMKQLLIKRGERYRELCVKKKGRQMFDYEGDLLARGTGVRKTVTRHQVRGKMHLRQIVN